MDGADFVRGGIDVAGFRDAVLRAGVVDGVRRHNSRNAVAGKLAGCVVDAAHLPHAQAAHAGDEQGEQSHGQREFCSQFHLNILYIIPCGGIEEDGEPCADQARRRTRPEASGTVRKRGRGWPGMGRNRGYGRKTRPRGSEEGWNGLNQEDAPGFFAGADGPHPEQGEELRDGLKAAVPFPARDGAVVMAGHAPVRNRELFRDFVAACRGVLEAQPFQMFFVGLLCIVQKERQGTGRAETTPSSPGRCAAAGVRTTTCAHGESGRQAAAKRGTTGYGATVGKSWSVIPQKNSLHVMPKTSMKKYAVPVEKATRRQGFLPMYVFSNIDGMK